MRVCQKKKNKEGEGWEGGGRGERGQGRERKEGGEERDREYSVTFKVLISGSQPLI